MHQRSAGVGLGVEARTEQMTRRSFGPVQHGIMPRVGEPCPKQRHTMLLGTVSSPECHEKVGSTVNGWMCPNPYGGYGAYPYRRWRDPEAEHEWEERHMLREIYRGMHRLLREEAEEAHEINEIYHLCHEIARMVAGQRPMEMPEPVMPPTPMVPPMAPSPIVAPAPMYPCPSRPPMGVI